MVYEISTNKGYGYCQYTNFAKDVILGKERRLVNRYKGLDILAIYPEVFEKKLKDHEILGLIDKKPLCFCMTKLPSRSFPEEMAKLKTYPVSDSNKEYPVMKMFSSVDPVTKKAETWIVVKDASEILFNGRCLPEEYLNVSELDIASIGLIINTIEKQKQPKDSIFVKGKEQ